MYTFVRALGPPTKIIIINKKASRKNKCKLDKINNRRDSASFLKIVAFQA